MKTTFKRIAVEDCKVFYREAGNANKPTISHCAEIAEYIKEFLKRID